MVTDVNAAFHPQGGRFLVKPYPKNKRSRRFKLDPDLVVAISAHVAAHGLQSSDLLFRFGTFLDTPVGDVAAPAAPGRAARAHRAERRRPPVHSRHALGVHGRPVPLRPLPCRVRELPRRAASQLSRFAAWVRTRDTDGPCHATGSATTSGAPRAPPPALIRGRDFTTCATRMPRGCSPAAPTFKSSRSDSATAASQRPVSTSTRCLPPTKPRSPPSAASAGRFEPCQIRDD